MKNTKKLLKLLKANPDFPIIPIVATDCAAGCDTDYAMADLSDSALVEYITADFGDGLRTYFRDDQWEVEFTFAEQLSDENNNLPEKEIAKLAHDKAESLEWKKAIAIFINAKG